MKYSYYLLSIFLLTMMSCDHCEMLGSFELGNNLVLLEGDRIEDRIIVRCTGRSKECCKGGEYILPIYSEHYDANGKYREYVIEAKSDNDWVIAQTGVVQSDTVRYWYINKNFSLENVDCQKVKCDSIVLSHRAGPYTKNEFDRIIKTKNITVLFKD